MKISTYEIGQKTIKFSITNATKSNCEFEKLEKFPLQHGLNIHDENFIYESLREIYFIHSELKVSGKAFIILPHFLTTSRIMSLPVGSRKKINLMIPFQLDESLPQGSHSLHWIEEIYPISKNNTNVCLSIINKDLFQKEVFNNLQEISFYPSAVTSELSIYSNYFKLNNKKKKSVEFNNLMNSNFVILDMGENQTTGYFFSRGQLIFNHYSNIGSTNIDENISDNYNIDIEEARDFKENSSFLLTQEDYEHADPDQQVFARLMEKTLEPLILDFAKWDLAFRSKTSSELDHCLIVGGMSKMNNIDSFLCEHLEVETSTYKLPHFHDSNEYSDFFSHQLIASSVSKSEPIHSFLRNEYKLTSSSGNITSGTAVYFTRTLVISAILSFFLIVERVFLELQHEKTYKNFKTALKSKSLNLTKKDQIKYRKDLRKIDRLIKPRLEKISQTQEVLSIKESMNLDELFAQLTIIKSIEGIELIESSVQNQQILSKIKILKPEKKEEILSSLESQISGSLEKVQGLEYEVISKKL